MHFVTLTRLLVHEIRQHIKRFIARDCTSKCMKYFKTYKRDTHLLRFRYLNGNELTELYLRNPNLLRAK